MDKDGVNWSEVILHILPTSVQPSFHCCLLYVMVQMEFQKVFRNCVYGA